jgi:signal transduction histidine kinase
MDENGMWKVVADMHHRAVTSRRLRLFKWLMVFIPPVTVLLGHLVLEYREGLLGPTLGAHAEDPLVDLLVGGGLTFLALVLAYLFVDALFTLLRRLQAEAMAREQDMLTMRAVLQERERLSRELHDGAAQLVADLLVRLDTIKDLVVDDRRQAAEAELERLREVADEIYVDIGESITGLRSNVTERGLARALRDCVDQFEDRHRIPVVLQIDGAVDQVSPVIALQLFRLIQEALTNVRKHARAQQATVTITPDGPDLLKVVIADDGQGFTNDSPSNGEARPLGLTSMRERVEHLGGTFHVDSRPGSGTHVTATISIPGTGRKSGHGAIATPAG